MTLFVHHGDSCETPNTSYPQLHVSEIHYNPSSAQGNYSDWEFLELYNLNAESVALESWRLSNAVALTFQANDTIPGLGFFTVARNMDSLLTVLRDGAHYSEWNSGEGLNNKGETIELQFPDAAIQMPVT